ncbi:MAG: hypothetical protein AAFW98_08125 [Pseudomonadota bacterium]
MRVLLTILSVVYGLTAAWAGEATVEAVTARQASDGTWRFDVTVRHADTGWDHYANAFTIETTDGAALGTRTLHHPHVEEHPFTRSLSGVSIPDGVSVVLVRAVDSVHGPGEAVEVTLPR